MPARPETAQQSSRGAPAALVYLQACSIKNRIAWRLRRLKQPKYLAGAVVGGLYVYFYFIRFLFLPAAHRYQAAPIDFSGNVRGTVEAIAALILLVVMLLAWIVPKDRVALSFSEAEVMFLFPAPLTRRTLIHFKLLKSQTAILFSTLILTLVSTRMGSGGKLWFHAAGWWLCLALFNLHALGASFAVTRLLHLGVAAWHRRLALGLGGALLFWGAFAWAGQHVGAPTEADLRSFKALAEYAHSALETPPLPTVLFPFRLVVKPYFAHNAVSFLQAVWPVLLLLGLHYLWVVRSEVAFEEATVEAARKRADAVALARAGKARPSNAPPRVLRPPFELHPTGTPAVALLWKNLISSGRLFNRRFGLVLLITGGATAVAMGPLLAQSGWAQTGAVLCGMLLIWSLLAGPQIARQDLRQDFAAIDVLKQFPMRGWQVVLGELLTPAVILTLVQWFLLLLLEILLARFPGQPGDFSGWLRLSIGSSAALLLPPLNLVLLLIPNAALLLWPGWMQTERGTHPGVEVLGQRIIILFGMLLAFVGAVLPAGLAFLLVLFLLRAVLPWTAVLPVAATAGAVILLIEGAVGLFLLGRLFEHFDLSDEPAG